MKKVETLMVNNSTINNKTNNHLNSLDIKKTIAYASCKLSHGHQFCNEMETV